MRTPFFILLTSCLIGISGCSESTDPGTNPEVEILYKTGFDSPSDTAGWMHMGEFSFYQDSIETGGNQCLHIGGFGLAVRAMKPLDSIPESSQVIFRFDARCLPSQFGASSVLLVAVTSSLPPPTAGAIFRNYEWMTFTDTALMPAGIPLGIDIKGSGVMTNMIIDNIEVKRIIPK